MNDPSRKVDKWWTCRKFTLWLTRGIFFFFFSKKKDIHGPNSRTRPAAKEPAMDKIAPCLSKKENRKRRWINGRKIDAWPVKSTNGEQKRALFRRRIVRKGDRRKRPGACKQD